MYEVLKMERNMKVKHNFVYQYFPINNQEKRRLVERRAKLKASLKNQEGYKGVKYRVEDLGDKFAVIAVFEVE